MSESIEKINQDIANMGYVVVTPIKPIVPSFYKLEDGTILSALIKVDHLLQNDRKSDILSVHTTTEIYVFVPPEKRDTPNEQRKPTQNVNIINNDVTCTPLREEYNVYELNKNLVLSIKTIVGQVVKTDQVSQQGEPIYNVQVQHVSKINPHN